MSKLELGKKSKDDNFQNNDVIIIFAVMKLSLSSITASHPSAER